MGTPLRPARDIYTVDAPPPPPACPGGTKDKCIALCDPTDPAKYVACVPNCDQNCPHLDEARRKYMPI